MGRIIVAAVRLLTISLKYPAMRSVTAPNTVEGIVRRLVSVVLNPRFRNDSVRYVCGGVVGTVLQSIVVRSSHTDTQGPTHVNHAQDI